MRRLVVVLSLLAGSAALMTAGAQAPADARLRRLFPSATTFSPKGGDPPHIKAYGGDVLLGYAFWTTELLPLERGYGGPIAILVGLDTKGTLTGVIVGAITAAWRFPIDPSIWRSPRKGRATHSSRPDVDRVAGDVTRSGAVQQFAQRQTDGPSVPHHHHRL
jgi:hypothetical protein